MKTQKTNNTVRTSYANTASLSRLITDHAPMVKRIVYHLLPRLPNTVQFDDLLQAGMLGLLEAAQHYDPNKGASFETYAGIRIRGMMLDEVRKYNWVPRSVYHNARQITDTVNVLTHQLGRNAHDGEVAEAMNISLEDYQHMLRDIDSAQLSTLDDEVANHEISEGAFPKTITILDPLEGIQFSKFCELLAECIENLPDRERFVLTLYYDEGLNLKEIGNRLGVSESRICQLHGQAMSRLQSRVFDSQ